MTTNRKGRAGCNQATLNTSKHTYNLTGLVVHIKPVVIVPTPWGLFPITRADWLITVGGLSDV